MEPILAGLPRLHQPVVRMQVLNGVGRVLGEKNHFYRLATADGLERAGLSEPMMQRILRLLSRAATLRKEWEALQEPAKQAAKALAGDNLEAFTEHTRRIAEQVLAVPDAPPVAGGTDCASIVDLNTWVATLVDNSLDVTGVKQVAVNWGDGGAISSVIDTTAPYSLVGTVFTRTYRNAGSRVIKQTAYDTIGQANVRTCPPVTLATFGLSGNALRDQITKVRQVFFLEELGKTEATWVYEVDHFGPFFVAIDAHGNNYFEQLAADVSCALPGIERDLGIPADYAFTNVNPDSSANM